MKITTTLMVTALATVALNVKSASLLSWGNLSSPGDEDAGASYNIVSSSGALLNNTHSAFLIYLVRSTDGTINWNPVTQTVGGDETTLVSWNWGDNFSNNGVAGYLYRDLQSGLGDNIGALGNGSYLYTVIVNLGVESLILDGAGTSGGGAFQLQDGLNYNNSNTSGSYDTSGNGGTTAPHQWVAVPEPSTYAFMGIGALLLAIRRFRRA